MMTKTQKQVKIWRTHFLLNLLLVPVGNLVHTAVFVLQCYFRSFFLYTNEHIPSLAQSQTDTPDVCLCLSLSPYTHTPTPSASLSLALFLFLYTTYTISLLQAHPYKFLPLFAKQFFPLLLAHSSVCIASQARGPIPLFSSKWWGGSIPVIVVILLVRFFSCWCRFGLLFTSLSLFLSCSRATCPAFNSACTSWWAWLQW